MAILACQVGQKSHIHIPPVRNQCATTYSWHSVVVPGCGCTSCTVFCVMPTYLTGAFENMYAMGGITQTNAESFYQQVAKDADVLDFLKAEINNNRVPLLLEILSRTALK